MQEEVTFLALFFCICIPIYLSYHMNGFIINRRANIIQHQLENTLQTGYMPQCNALLARTVSTYVSCNWISTQLHYEESSSILSTLIILFSPLSTSYNMAVACL